MKITLQKIYADFRDKKGDHDVAQALFRQTDWFCHVAEFDPKTGEALPQSLSIVLAKVAEYSLQNIGEPIRDRLWRIAEHSRASVERLFRVLNESPRREQALLPVRAVRELDANSFIKLSNRPGRNIREKLAGKPYLQAVRRFQSVDLPENRLLKSFATRLAELLELRQDYLNEEGNELLPKIQFWLRSDLVKGIARWDNLPPNNTLLSHRDYRRVWDSWRWLQNLDDDISRDFSQIKARGETTRFWTEHAQKWADGGYFFVEMPILFDFEKFEVHPWLSELVFRKAPQKISRVPSVDEILEPVCVDLSILRPRFANTTESFRVLRNTYFWQRWTKGDDSVDLDLFGSDAAYLHPNATSISSTDLFFSKDNTSEYFDRAARAFAAKLRGAFKSDSLIWLVPDSLNDFKLEVIRRNLNSRFPDAEPLPRSVAAAFERVDYSKIRGDDFAIVVVDSSSGKTCITKLLARFDQELKKCLPETFGFYWERCPPVVIASTDPERAEGNSYDLITVDDEGRWRDATQPAKTQSINPSSLKLDPRVGQFEMCINLTGSPVIGGIRLNLLRQRAGDIPLWRDQVSELSIKVMNDGRYQRFHLVSRDTTVKPVRGMSIPISVEKDFTLPAGKLFYQFPLFQGENDDETGFSARLDSPAFPLKGSRVCKLNLTFEYGANEPYKLVFTPLDKSFPPVRASWRKAEETVIVDAPSPEYPTPMTWAEVRFEPKRNSSEAVDLLDKVLTGVSRLDRDLFIRPKPSKTRTTGKITSHWHKGKSGAHFAFVQCNKTDESVFINETKFADGFSYEDFKEGDSVSFELQDRGGKYSGWKIAGVDYREPLQSTRLKVFDSSTAQGVRENIYKRLYRPVIQVWRDGRSISDADCPSDFRDAMCTNIEYLASLLQHDGIPIPVKYAVVFLLACMHKDTHNECVQRITEQVKSGKILARKAVGFALGDLSEQWQRDARNALVTHLTDDSLRVFAYGIWREPHFVERFSFADLKSILQRLTVMLLNIKQCPRRRDEKDEWTVRNWIRSTAEPLELLLGLLRTRAASDSEIKMLLQPHQNITKELVKHVERVTGIVANSNVTLTSHVQINIKKPEGESNTPDLLYALRLYLTGDDGANAIHIASVADSESD